MLATRSTRKETSARLGLLPLPSAVCAALALTVLLCRDARADWDVNHPTERPNVGPEPSTHPPPLELPDWDFEIGGKAGYLSPPIRGGTTPFGAGFGGRLGFAFYGFYLGASVIDYLGGTDVNVSDHALLYGLELGYGLRLVVGADTFFTLRPQLGVGGAAISHTDPNIKPDVITRASSSSSSSDTTVVSNVYFEPGLTTMFTSGAHFVAVNASALVVPGISYGVTDPTTWVSYGLQGQIGFRF